MKILLGVCGGVAAYKAAELTRELQRRGVNVQVAMTASAERFVAPLTFASLSGRQVLRSIWEPSTEEATQTNAGEFDIEHIRVAQEVDAVVIAPATAHFIAKLAHGMADDLLSTICVATPAPIYLAPAMNVQMWKSAAVRKNMELLRERGVRILDPGAGLLACGMVGEGRLMEPIQIADAVLAQSARTKDLAGETILITMGGTREPIDPVRFIGNRSSGKMGKALAEAAAARGAGVIVVAAHVACEAIAGCERVEVSTGEEMMNAVMMHLPRASAVIMAAAVSDYRVVRPAAQKIKKRPELLLELTQNEDILRQVVLRRDADTVVIGFAAETERVKEEGRRKLMEKSVDAIVANDVSGPDGAFESDRNAGYFVTREEEVELKRTSKREMAEAILDRLKALRESRTGASR